MKRFISVVLLATVAACGKKAEQTLAIQTAPVARRTIVVDASASGTVEPINIVEVKSKASGQITNMPVETGSNVRPGDLLVQLDTRDVQNQYDQALADERAAEARLKVSEAQRKRSDDMFSQQVITAQEHETASLDYANAQAQAVRARTSLDLAKQRLEDATVRAPVAGTVIDKTVSLGQVITSATSSFGGGTTLLKMADLSQVRVRALFNETDIGSVLPGQSATVRVDAYPDRPFRGTVDKIEPQAVVQQSVTMFPVLISISNLEGLLKPGMNGEASVLVEQRENVLAVPNDAVRSVREAATVAPMLGLNADSVQAQVQAQMQSQFTGGPAGAPTGGAAPRLMSSQGDVVLASQAGQGARPSPQQMQQMATAPQVTEAQCTAFRAALAQKPDVQKQLQALRQKGASGEMDFQAMRAETQKLYASAGVDANVARGCQMRERMAQGGAPGATAGAAGGRRSANPAAPNSAPRGNQSAAPVPAGEFSQSNRPQRTRSGLVFVASNGSYVPKVVRLGLGNFDYTEVVSGLEEGEQVALLAAAALQIQREQANDRFRNMTGGGVPGMQRQTPAAGGTGGAGGAGGAPGGGRRP